MVEKSAQIIIQAIIVHGDILKKLMLRGIH